VILEEKRKTKSVIVIFYLDFENEKYKKKRLMNTIRMKSLFDYLNNFELFWYV